MYVVLCVGCDVHLLERGFAYTGLIRSRPKPNKEVPLLGKSKALLPSHVTCVGSISILFSIHNCYRSNTWTSQVTQIIQYKTLNKTILYDTIQKP